MHVRKLPQQGTIYRAVKLELITLIPLHVSLASGRDKLMFYLSKKLSNLFTYYSQRREQKAANRRPFVEDAVFS